MLLNRGAPLAALMAIASLGLPAREAQAGPLLDWLFGWRRTAPAYPVGQPVPVGGAYAAGYAGYPNGYPLNPSQNSGFAANYGTYYSSQLPVIGPAGAGYPAPQPGGITAATLPSTMTYVPNYQSSAYRAPVTYYRPVLTTDPNTGAQVVAMAPCTSYEYLTQRTPTVGRSALYGSSTPPAFQPPPQALPTYTLPSGGIPLANSAPAVSAPYVSGYGPNGYGGAYSALQPPSATYPSAPANATGAYPTAPLGQVPSYGAVNGGSCGGYASPSTVPGLVAPQAPASSVPSYSQPSYSQPSYSQPGISPPPSTSPAPGGVYPPAGGSSTNPADFPPSLPPTFPTSRSSASQSDLRPQLRSMVRQPRSDEQTALGSTQDEHNSNELRPLPTMKPIPVPKGFEAEPRWNPGLLREEDMTALQPMAAELAKYAGQSKPIHWASFEQQSHSAAKVPAADGLRPIISTVVPPANEAARSWPNTGSLEQPPARKTGGWKASPTSR